MFILQHIYSGFDKFRLICLLLLLLQFTFFFNINETELGL
jgi:hypothetical protein